MTGETLTARLIRVGDKEYTIKTIGLKNKGKTALRVVVENGKTGKVLFSRTLPYLETVGDTVIFGDKDRGMFIAIIGNKNILGETEFHNFLLGIYSIPHGIRFFFNYSRTRSMEQPFPSLFSFVMELEKEHFDFNTFLLEEIRRGQYELLSQELDLLKDVSLALTIGNRKNQPIDKLKLFTLNNFIPIQVSVLGREIGGAMDALASYIQSQVDYPEPAVSQKEIERFKEAFSVKIEMETGALVSHNYITQYGKLFGGLLFLFHNGGLYSFGYLFDGETVKGKYDEIVEEGLKSIKRTIREAEKEDGNPPKFSLFFAIKADGLSEQEREVVAQNISKIINEFEDNIDIFVNSLSLAENAVDSIEALVLLED